MVGSIFTQFVTRNVNSPKSTEPPFFNMVNISNLNRRTVSYVNVERKRRLMKYMEQWSGILSGLINKVTRDINEEVYFEPLNPRESNRNRVKTAEKFHKTNFLRMQRYAAVSDMLTTGEGYYYLGFPSKKELNKQVSQALEKKGLPNTETARQLYMKVNNLFSPMSIKSVASSTVENVYDEREIVKYVQHVGTENPEYSPEQILHMVFYPLNGRPFGFTPLLALLEQLDLDWFMWQNMKAVSKNSGQPDRLYSVEDIDVNSPAFKRIEQELRKYHTVQERHGSLLLNGKINVQDLQQIDSMQFENLGVYIAGILALQWSIPRSRIPFMSKEANTKEDTGGNSEKDYYDNISYLQDMLVLQENQRIWEPHYGVTLKFNRSYSQDKIRDAQHKQFRLDSLDKISSELAKNGKRLKHDYVIRYFNGINEDIDPEDIEDIPEPQPQPSQEPSNSNSMSNEDLQRSQDDQNVSDRKRDQANSANEREMNNGMGKELSTPQPKISFKELLSEDISNKEVQSVPFSTFIKLYNEDKAMAVEPPRVFMSSDGGYTRFIYRSTDFVYTAFQPDDNVNNTTLMNFRKVYRLPSDEFTEVYNPSGSIEVVTDTEEDDDSDSEPETGDLSDSR